MPHITTDHSDPLLTLPGFLKLVAVWALLFGACALVWADSASNHATKTDAANAESPLSTTVSSFESGPHKVSLIELYTSEGCSSCPPADRWLSSLKEGEALWETVVPVAFHVSYWDRLGWPDRFAQRGFDTRQRLLAQRADAGVYTPGMFRDGAEFRRWRNWYGNPIKTVDRAFIAASSRSSPSGNLRLKQSDRVGPNGWALRFDPVPGSATQAKEAFVAVLGNNLHSEIRRGENAGKELTHNFVVLELVTKSLTAKGSNTLGADFTLDPAVYRDATAEPALAAWVVDQNGNPVQALGGPL